MTTIGIDPGSSESAYCVFNGSTFFGDKFTHFGKVVNSEIIEVICDNIRITNNARVFIEGLQSFGMPVGKEVFETAYMVGRIRQWLDMKGHHNHLVYRSEVKLHFCQSTRAKDANIRQALIDRFGAPGTKKNPGGTYGLKADMWSAAAIAVYGYDKLQLT